jgi:hypothetical protein
LLFTWLGGPNQFYLLFAVGHIATDGDKAEGEIELDSIPDVVFLVLLKFSKHKSPEIRNQTLTAFGTHF